MLNHEQGDVRKTQALCNALSLFNNFMLHYDFKSLNVYKTEHASLTSMLPPLTMHYDQTAEGTHSWRPTSNSPNKSVGIDSGSVTSGSSFQNRHQAAFLTEVNSPYWSRLIKRIGESIRACLFRRARWRTACPLEGLISYPGLDVSAIRGSMFHKVR